jgi:hypothetical protein
MNSGTWHRLSPLKKGARASRPLFSASRRKLPCDVKSKLRGKTCGTEPVGGTPTGATGTVAIPNPTATEHGRQL